MFSNKLSDLVLVTKGKVGCASLSSEMGGEGRLGGVAPPSPPSSQHLIKSSQCLDSVATLGSDPSKTEVSYSPRGMRVSRQKRSETTPVQE